MVDGSMRRLSDAFDAELCNAVLALFAPDGRFENRASGSVAAGADAIHIAAPDREARLQTISAD